MADTASTPATTTPAAAAGRPKPSRKQPPLPSATAKARFVHVAPRKARRVVDLVRGLKADQALAVLEFAPQAASEDVYKVLASAVANAQHNVQLAPETLWVREAFVDEGPTLKRFRPRAQGRAYRIRKRTSHITVTVESRPSATPAGRGRGRASRTGGTR